MLTSSKVPNFCALSQGIMEHLGLYILEPLAEFYTNPFLLLKENLYKFSGNATLEQQLQSPRESPVFLSFSFF